VERLEESAELDALRWAHARFYQALAEEAKPEIDWIGRRLGEYLARLEREHANLSTALAWAFEQSHMEIALGLGTP